MIEVVAGILLNNKKEILIAKRKKEKKLGGYWEFPGGKIEEGENPEESLIRELDEEMDIDIEVIDYFDENLHDYGNGEIKLIAYTARIIDGEINLKDHDEYLWINKDELMTYDLAPADIPFAQKLKDL